MENKTAELELATKALVAGKERLELAKSSAAEAEKNAGDAQLKSHQEEVEALEKAEQETRVRLESANETAQKAVLKAKLLIEGRASVNKNAAAAREQGVVR